MKLSLIPAALAAALLITGCTAGPDYKMPQMRTPQQWPTPSRDKSYAEPNTLSGWWSRLNDPALDELVRAALEGSHDIKTAALRVLRARTQRDLAANLYYPQVDGLGGYSRTRPSGNSYQAASGFPPEAYNSYSASFDASWEIDVFGRIKRSVQSAEYSYHATVEDYRGVMVALLAETATNYVDFRTAQQRIQFANDNIQIQRETLKLTRARYDAGLVPELDVVQAQTNLANTESVVPQLRKQQTRALNRLASLIGVFPAEMEKLQSKSPIPTVDKTVPILAPAEILRQRPDLRSAERTLAARTAEIGVAEADLYPAFSLTGYFGFESMDFENIAEWNSRMYGVGPSFRWNILNGDRVRNTIRIRKLLAEEAYINYEKSVLLAVEEVADAMTFFAEEQKRFQALRRSVRASRKSVKLVRSLYENGLTDFQNVLDSQRTLFNQQDSLAQSKGQIAKHWIGIYQAFGGGWWNEINPNKKTDVKSGSPAPEVELDQYPEKGFFKQQRPYIK